MLGLGDKIECLFWCMFDQIPQYQYFNNIIVVIIGSFMKYEDNEIFDQ